MVWVCFRFPSEQWSEQKHRSVSTSSRRSTPSPLRVPARPRLLLSHFSHLVIDGGREVLEF